MFKFREMKQVKHFLEMRVIIQNKKNESNRVVYLIQNAYADKLIKDYSIKIEERINQTSLSS